MELTCRLATVAGIVIGAGELLLLLLYTALYRISILLLMLRHVFADTHLLEHETTVRRSANDDRRKARNALALQGKIATETEIRRWIVANDAIRNSKGIGGATT
jgi:hypothetical protein